MPQALRMIIDEAKQKENETCSECNGTQSLKFKKEVVGGSGQIHIIDGSTICRCVFHRHASFDNTKGVSFARPVTIESAKSK